MAEFLFRGWNVAVPEVDVGDDILVVRDASGEFVRVQVKTAQAKLLKNGGHSARFNIPIGQLTSPVTPELTYALMTRKESGGWLAPVIISRSELNDLWQIYGIGSATADSLFLAISFAASGQRATCSRQSFDGFLDNYSNFPVIPH